MCIFRLEATKRPLNEALKPWKLMEALVMHHLPPTLSPGRSKMQSWAVADWSDSSNLLCKSGDWKAWCYQDSEAISEAWHSDGFTHSYDDSRLSFLLQNPRTPERFQKGFWRGLWGGLWRGLWKGFCRVFGRAWAEGPFQNPFKTSSRTLRKPFKKVSKSMMRSVALKSVPGSGGLVAGDESLEWRCPHRISTHRLTNLRMSTRKCWRSSRMDRVLSTILLTFTRCACQLSSRPFAMLWLALLDTKWTGQSWA